MRYLVPERLGKLMALFSCGLVLLTNTVAAEEQLLAQELLADLVAIPTSKDNGTARQAAELLAERLESVGFSNEEVQLLGPSATVGGLVVRLPGSGTGKPVLMLAHLDIVPANTDSWSSNPYRLESRDGYLYGRGTMDNKAGAAMLVANLMRMKQEGITPRRDLIAVLTLDEESDMRSIQWLLQHHPALLGAEFALNTDAGGVQETNGKMSTFSIQSAEKVYMTLEIRVNNPGGHSSIPQAENAIYSLAEALGRISAYRFPVSLNSITRVTFAMPDSTVDASVSAAMQRLASNAETVDDILLLQGIPALNAQMRTTCVATQISGGHAENALPTYAKAVINCRILPQESGDDVMSKLTELIADDAVVVRQTYAPVTSPASAMAPEVLDRVARIAAEIFPGASVVPEMSTGATDGLYTRSAGIPTYGVSAIAASPDENRSHGIDERVGQAAFVASVEFWYRLMLSL